MPSTKKIKDTFNKFAGEKMNVVVFDIETSHNILAEFGLYGEKSGNPDNIIQDWFIICAAWKILGDDEIHAVSILDNKKRFKKDRSDDYVVVKKMHDVLSKADVIIGHNMQGFDWKKLNTRFIVHGLPPLSKKRIADTYKIAKREFSFTSNKLDFIAQKLKIGKKMDAPKGLWLRALFGDEEAIHKMVEYNKVDVDITEKVYFALRPYDTAPINFSTHAESEDCTCPRCMSDDLQKRGYSYTNAGKFQRYQCNDCGGWARGRQNLLSKSSLGYKPGFTHAQ